MTAMSQVLIDELIADNILPEVVSYLLDLDSSGAFDDIRQSRSLLAEQFALSEDELDAVLAYYIEKHSKKTKGGKHVRA